MSLTGGLSASLTCHLSMGLGGGVAAQSAAWNPGDLTGLVATLLPAESLARGLLWQNTAKTVAATADGDPVKVAVCPYTAVEFTAPSDAARPLLWDEGGGLWSLAFDGVDDRMVTAGLTWTGSIGSASARFVRSGGSNVPVYQTRNENSNGDYYSAGAQNYSRNFRATRLNTYFVPPVDTSPHTYTQVSGTDYRVYVDGTQRGTTAVVAWEAPANAVAGAGDSLSGGGAYLSGRISGLILAAAGWDDATREIVETYLGAL